MILSETKKVYELVDNICMQTSKLGCYKQLDAIAKGQQIFLAWRVDR